VVISEATDEDAVMAENKTIIQVNNLSFHYPESETIFSRVSFSLEKGEIFSILGPNGAGKSTLLNCLTNLNRPSGGEVVVDGKPIAYLSQKRIAQLFGYVPQVYNLAYDYSVRDYVVMGRSPYISTFAVPKAEDYALVDSTLEELGISHLAERAYTKISGGERQQCAIARVVVQQPEIIILDEPTNHLDYGNQLKILRLIKSLSQRGYTVIMTSHNPDHVVLLGGTVGVLDNDGLFSVGTCEDILSTERLCAIYRTDLKVVYIPEVGRMSCIPMKL
jgi:iron complex transport system ATP-binding protein